MPLIFTAEKNNSSMQNILRFLCCPSCKANLAKKGETLVCTECKVKYTIERFIPILLDTHNMPSYLTHQISYFEEEDKTRPQYKLAEWQKSYLRRFFENVEVNKKTIVLDIGCGSGYMTIELARRGATVIACDLTVAQLHKLQNEIQKFNLNNRLFLICCSAESLPFKSAIADVVIENAILEHLPHERKAIKEIKRVSKENATIMVSVPHAYRYLWPFLIPVNLWFDKKIGHLRRYTKKELLTKFNDFSLRRVYYTGNLFKFLLFLLQILLKRKAIDKFMETVDRRFEKLAYGATVITVFLKRR